MAVLENPLPHLVKATEAASKIISLKTDLLVLEQELNALRQFKRAVFFGISFVLFNLLCVLSFFWLGMALHEHGWSSYQLALISFLFFGTLTGASVFMAIRVGQGKEES